MHTFLRTDASAPDRANEDAALAVGPVAVLVDGAGIPRAYRAGCVHSVAWFATNLAAELAAALADPSMPMRPALAAAVRAVRDLHAHTCDLDAGSPSATVVAVRERGEVLEHLVLCDSSLFLRARDGGTARITDDRLAVIATSGRSGDEIEALRNRPGGFWVARHEERAAEEALVGSVPLVDLAGAVLASDGVTRACDELGLMDAATLGSDCATATGAVRLISRIREAEVRRAAEGTPGLRKVHDDATVIGCSFGVEGHGVG